MWVGVADESTAKGEWKARAWVVAASERESERECLATDWRRAEDMLVEVGGRELGWAGGDGGL